jgi:hypothetical protein
VAVAIHSHHDEHDQFPKDITDKAGKPLLSWRVAILPSLDHGFLYRQFRPDEPWDSDHNKKLLPYMPDCFRAPVQPAGAADTYVRAFAGPLTVFDPKERVTFSGVNDGTSNTLLLAEAGPAVPWTKPADVPFDPDGDPPALEGPYTDAVHAAWADGSVVRLRPTPAAQPLKAAVTRNQGEVYEVKDLLAAPAKPVNDEERKQLDGLREALRWEVREAAGSADDRFQVEQALRKLGPLPSPDPSAVQTLDELAQLREAVQTRKWADRDEYDRLLEELRKKDPKAAERIEAARQERRLKEAKEREK